MVEKMNNEKFLEIAKEISGWYFQFLGEKFLKNKIQIPTSEAIKNLDALV